MDSITQAALGATVAGAIAGKRCNAKVLLAGAALGTLPDLDVLINYGDDVSNVIKHRGFSHSLLVLLPFSVALTWLLQRWSRLQSWSFTHLWALVAAALITHPLLDAFTTYGTQLIWPFNGYFAVSSVFIIDPLYTLPLLLALAVGLFRKPNMARSCAIGLVVSSGYLGWSVLALHQVEQRAQQSLVHSGIAADKVFITPTPFNTVLWRVVAVDGDRYFEGLTSLLDAQPQIDFLAQVKGAWPLADEPLQLSQYRYFADDLLRYHQDGDQLVVEDLRMGMHQNLAFRFQFAKLDEQHQWQAVMPVRLERGAIQGDPALLWQRLLGNQQIDAGLSWRHHRGDEPVPLVEMK